MTDNEFNLEFNKELLYYRENVVATVYITIHACTACMSLQKQDWSLPI